MPDETVAQKPNEPATRTHSSGEVGSTRAQSDQDAKSSAEKSARLEVPGYQLLEAVGQGGMGTVYRARDLSLNRDVAVKLLQDRYPADGPTAKRFLEEAQITGQLQHPGIPAVHQVGTYADGRPFLAMKLIKGRSLADMLAAKEPINVLAVFEQIAQAVGYAHAHGVIHRDLKPANVMVGAFGEVQVMDWGLAKLLASGGCEPPGSNSEPVETRIHVERESDHTQAGSTLGTVAFMPPEQAVGAHDQMGPPSDVFGLGAVLCTLLTGQPPYVAESWESTRQLAAMAKQTDALARLAHCGAEPELVALCQHCLAPEPKDRPANGAAVAEAVAKLRAAADERARQAEVDRAKAEVQSLADRKRRRVQLMFGGAVLVTLLIGSAVAGWQAWEANKSARQADAKTLEAENEVRAAIAANAELLAVADERQFALSFPKIAEKSELAIPPLLTIIETKIADDANDDDKERLAKQQANAAVALLRMNQSDKAWPLLKHQPDPRARSYMIHRLAPLGADPQLIIARLGEEPEVSIRRALLLSLGEFTEAQFPPDQRNALLPQLQTLYRTDPDAGLHAAAEWLLRTWKQDAWLKQVNDELSKASGGRQPPVSTSSQKQNRGADTPRSPSWSVNSQGQTMILIPGPIEFLMGSPKTEAGRYSNYEEQHPMKINRSFAIAAKPVTLEQYRKFAAKHEASTMSTGSVECPVVNVSWHEAAAYCNWLSEQEKIPKDQWCYELNETGEVAKLKPKYLSLTGYRLPTEAEWEYAARAGSRTSRYFGETEDLLPKYAWYDQNSSRKAQPVGLLKPNDFGCFDMLGNVFQWNVNNYQTKPQGEDVEGELVIKDTYGHALRGGTFNHQALRSRSANRNGSVPANRSNYYGFRPVRTFPLNGFAALPPSRSDRNLKFHSYTYT